MQTQESSGPEAAQSQPRLLHLCKHLANAESIFPTTCTGVRLTPHAPHQWCLIVGTESRDEAVTLMLQCRDSGRQSLLPSPHAEFFTPPCTGLHTPHHRHTLVLSLSFPEALSSVEQALHEGDHLHTGSINKRLMKN